jgi:hypothetical protein
MHMLVRIQLPIVLWILRRFLESNSKRFTA